MLREGDGQEAWRERTPEPTTSGKVAVDLFWWSSWLWRRQLKEQALTDAPPSEERQRNAFVAVGVVAQLCSVRRCRFAHPSALVAHVDVALVVRHAEDPHAFADSRTGSARQQGARASTSPSAASPSCCAP